MSRVSLRLFVAGQTERSRRAIQTLREICEERFRGEYELVVVDVLERPGQAEEERILATPAITKELPLPIRRVIGDLSDKQAVLLGLEIDCLKSAEGGRRPPRSVVMSEATRGVQKLPTGIPGFDLIAQGGIPRGRTTLVAGTAGSAKTVFAAQFLAEGVRNYGQPGVFVTFEESPDDIRQNIFALGWDLPSWERDGLWAFVDASPQPGDRPAEVGRYDLGGLLARIEHAVRKVRAERVALDSLGAIFSQFSDRATVRSELFRIARLMRAMEVTCVMTAERDHEYGDVARFGVEEFVADNVIILRNVLEQEKRRRTVEILKFRGTSHQKGEWPFTIMPHRGIVGIPLSAIELKQRSSETRISSGVPQLDQMCGGGYFQNSVVLVSGATGTGKTLLATHFVAGESIGNTRSLLLAFEESRSQLFRNAYGWGMDFDRLETAGVLRVDCEYPEVASLEDHLLRIKQVISDFGPQRVAIDSLSALQRISTIKTFREFVIALSSFLKEQEIAGLFTAATPSLLGGATLTEAHVSTITDSIILLRYVEMYGEMRRGITVLKMRGSTHDKEIREFMIDHRGMHVGKTFRNVSGILTGEPTQVSPDVVDRIGSLFRDEPAGALNGFGPGDGAVFDGRADEESTQ
ncbi:MAG: circadian clock protein KaiC [Planctomycetota bacterium]